MSCAYYIFKALAFYSQIQTYGIKLNISNLRDIKLRLISNLRDIKLRLTEIKQVAQVTPLEHDGTSGTSGSNTFAVNR